MKKKIRRYIVRHTVESVIETYGDGLDVDYVAREIGDAYQDSEFTVRPNGDSGLRPVYGNVESVEHEVVYEEIVDETDGDEPETHIKRKGRPMYSRVKPSIEKLLYENDKIVVVRPRFKWMMK